MYLQYTYLYALYKRQQSIVTWRPFIISPQESQCDKVGRFSCSPSTQILFCPETRTSLPGGNSKIILVVSKTLGALCLFLKALMIRLCETLRCIAHCAVPHPALCSAELHYVPCVQHLGATDPSIFIKSLPKTLSFVEEKKDTIIFVALLRPATCIEIGWGLTRARLQCCSYEV